MITDRKLQSWINQAKKNISTTYTQNKISPNLWFRVSAATNTAVFIYRVTLPNTKTWYTIGEYPAVTLHEANQKALQLRVLVKQGISPTLYDKELESKQKTVGEVFELMFTSLINKGIAKNSINQIKSFQNLYLPTFAGSQIDTLTPQAIRTKVINPLIEAGALNTAHTVLLRYKQLSKFAYEREYTSSNVLERLRNDFFTPQSRSRVLSNDDLAKLLPWLSSNDDTTSKYIRLSLMLGTRLIELLTIKWQNVDLVNGTILLTDTKNKLDLLIKLPPQALDIVKQLRTIKYGDYVFSNGVKSFSKRSISDTIKKAIADTGIEAFTPHDIRRTFSSRLAELKFSLDLIDCATNHKLTGVRKNYVHTLRIDERYDMLRTWADYLDEVMK